MVGHIGKLWAFCALGKQVSWHPQNGKLPLSGRAGFLFFDSAVWALIQDGWWLALGLCAL
jgi:hypothetical protein